MVAQSIVELANGVGVELSQRHAQGSYVYNGVSIALRRNDTFEYLDHEVLHEVCHWMVAIPEARVLPDFGLSIGAADTLASGNVDYDTSCISEYTTYSRGEHGRSLSGGGLLYISKVEEYEQELAAQVLCVHIGSRLGIDSSIRTFSPSSGEGVPCEACTWQQYTEAITRRLSPSNMSGAASARWIAMMNAEAGIPLFKHTPDPRAREACLEFARAVGHRAMRALVTYQRAIHNVTGT